MNRDSDLQIDLRQMIIAIETAVSLVGMNDVNHGKRVGYIAGQIGSTLGLSDADIQFLFELGLLHDCGVSTEQVHSNLINNFAWEDADVHCEIGFHLLKDFVPLSKFAVPIKYHHTPWSRLKESDVTLFDQRMANIIFLSDRIDTLACGHYESDILLLREKIVEEISNYSGSFFKPEFVEAFVSSEKAEAFWISLEDRHVTRYVWDMGKQKSQELLSLADIKQLCRIMSYIVDQKSSFTAQHSLRVADLAKFMAKVYGLSESQCDKVEIAGLLHDIGKLHMPDDILEKPGPLEPIERAIMNQHSYETYEILRHIEGLDEVAKWAAFHHEGINGTGYPFHPKKQELSTEARIIAVADVFQALVQDRPYREGMDIPQVIDVLDAFARKGKLDNTLVELVHANIGECYAVARGEDAEGNKLKNTELLSGVIVGSYTSPAN
ncbi:HD domain-containing protein [Parasalinivibrio latis]|uniref:HD-GYP domain-containing protein n=1 Tax=Parasalinivibrio latis TaxID=2952610 RepID=UPI0030E4F41D